MMRERIILTRLLVLEYVHRDVLPCDRGIVLGKFRPRLCVPIRRILTCTQVAKKDFTYKAIISIIEQVPHVPEELRPSLSTTGIQECCVQYVATIIVLMGVCHKIINWKVNSEKPYSV